MVGGADRAARPEQVDARVDARAERRDVVLVAVAPVDRRADESAAGRAEARVDAVDEGDMRLDELAEAPRSESCCSSRGMSSRSSPGLRRRVRRSTRTWRTTRRRLRRSSSESRDPATGRTRNRCRVGGRLRVTRRGVQVVAGIRRAPLPAEERVVLRGVDERVHATGRDEFDEVQPLGVRPGPAVEALDDTADGERRRSCPLMRRARRLHEPGVGGVPALHVAAGVDVRGDAAIDEQLDRFGDDGIEDRSADDRRRRSDLPIEPADVDCRVTHARHRCRSRRPRARAGAGGRSGERRRGGVLQARHGDHADASLANPLTSSRRPRCCPNSTRRSGHLPVRSDDPRAARPPVPAGAPATC